MGTSSLNGKSSRVLIPLASVLAVFSLCAPASSFAGPLPAGGTFVAGSGSIHAGNASLTINQSTPRAIINWADFSIDSGQRVSFLNGSGATLNRVTGGNPTLILGALSATGSVYLINPQGIVIGPGGSVATGGAFLASTLDTCNCSFMNGRPLTFKGDSNASVVNLGTIGSSGGNVILIARAQVLNAGTLSAPQGVAGLAVGARVLLQDTSSRQTVLVQTGSGGSIVNSGTIEAAQVSLQAADGNIFALAGQHTSIRATGTATRGGHVWLVADNGNVTIEGTIEARNAKGSGGRVDVDASTLTLGDAFGGSALVKAKQWNIKTPSFTIDSVATPALRQSLNAGTSIRLTATGAQGSSGNIDVASTIHWVGAAALTLNAYHSLTIEAGATLRNCGTGTMTLRADAKGRYDGGSVVNRGTIDWSHSFGVVSVFYDANGKYVSGTQKSNPAWMPSPSGGPRKQIEADALGPSHR